MRIGLLKETKPQEKRVALLPRHVHKLVRAGHQVFVGKGAGLGIGLSDWEYQNAGAQIESQLKKLIHQSDLLVKVKEPTLAEARLMYPGQMIFCYLHLASMPTLARLLLKQEVIALGYETLKFADGSLPLLKPMSEIAGKLATQNGAHFLRADQGGRGVLLGGTQTVTPAMVVILGGGVVGENAARIALGMGALTHLFDVSSLKRAQLKKRYPALKVHSSLPSLINKKILQADLVIGAVLIPGARAPRLVTEQMVKQMKKGAVIVDVAVDQGGCVETSVVTSHQKPVVTKYGVLHYGVPNMPGCVPVTATQALTHATFPFIYQIAQQGLNRAMDRFPPLRSAMNVCLGSVIHPALITIFQK